MTAYETIRNLHVLAGMITLACFWTAATLRKGSPAHLAVGRVFMVAMSAIAVTALPLAFTPLLSGRAITGSVLLYIVVITVTPTWLAWRAVRDQNDFARYTGPVYHVLAWTNLGAGLAMLATGLWLSNLLLTGISTIGLLTGFFMLRFARQAPPTQRRWWLVRHYVSILGAGIATHVAFLNIGFTRMLPPELGDTAQRLSWIVPFVVAGIARVWLDRRYGPKKRAATPANVVSAG